jgi:hypothetical protein
MYCYYNRYYRPNGAQQLVAPQTVGAYVGQTIITTIPGYGRVRAFVLGFNDNTGMASLLVATPGGQQYLEVHYSDMIGIAPVLAGGGQAGASGGMGQGQAGAGGGMGQGQGGGWNQIQGQGWMQQLLGGGQGGQGGGGWGGWF